MTEEFKVLKLVEPTSPILYEKMQPFSFEHPPCDPVELANNLITTMNHHNGMGLSANQCGLPYRVFVMRSNPTKVCFNPRVIDVSSEEVSLDEGCLSFPFLFVKIKRPAFIKVRYTDAYGETHTEKFIGMTARCFLHEMDHLEGINFTNRANIALLERAKRQQAKVLKRVKAGQRVINNQNYVKGGLSNETISTTQA